MDLTKLKDLVLNLLNEKNITKLAAASLFGILVTYCGKVWYSYQFFKKRGIKTPEYKYFWGNFPEIRKNKNYSEILRKWTQTYGATYGYYEGHLPILVTSDLEILEEICVKQYGNFSARKKGAIDRPDNHPLHSVFSATKTRWKRMRNIMNPTFSASKLRELNPLMIACTDRLVQKLAENTDTEIDVTDAFKRFSMDAIWNCVFGVDTDIQNEADNAYFAKSEAFFKLSADFNLAFYCGTYFYEIKAWVMMFVVVVNVLEYFLFDDKSVQPFIWMRMKILNVFKMRLKEPNSKKRDYMQLLIEAREANKTFVQSAINGDSLFFSELHLRRKITDKEIEMNLVIFLLAGYETTSSALSYMFYVLATHPEEQKTLLNEIDEHFPPDSDEIPNLDSVQKLPYLDMFVKETLRMYPIANAVVTRRCVNPTNIKGIDIPLNLSIVVDVLSLHYDKNLWGPEDPNEFYPLRFSPEHKRHPMAFMAFGQGPRNCIGMKFALFEAKVALVKILRNFEVYATSNTIKDFAYVEGIVRQPKNGVKVILKKENFSSFTFSNLYPVP